MTHRQQQQQQPGKATGLSSPPGGPELSDSSSSSSTAAGLPWLGLAGLNSLLDSGSVYEEVRVRMTHAAHQMAELASQLVSLQRLID